MPTAPPTATPTAPFYCSYLECDGEEFALLGVIGGAAYWRCTECGKDFAADTADG